jgi:hypothetical protein
MASAAAQASATVPRSGTRMAKQPASVLILRRRFLVELMSAPLMVDRVTHGPALGHQDGEAG